MPRVINMFFWESLVVILTQGWLAKRLKLLQGARRASGMETSILTRQRLYIKKREKNLRRQVKTETQKKPHESTPKQIHKKKQEKKNTRIITTCFFLFLLFSGCKTHTFLTPQKPRHTRTPGSFHRRDSFTALSLWTGKSLGQLFGLSFLFFWFESLFFLFNCFFFFFFFSESCFFGWFGFVLFFFPVNWFF